MPRWTIALRSLALLSLGVCLGTALAPRSGRSLQAGGGDRPDAPLATSGPIAIEHNRPLDIQVSKDAIYYLNYSKGRLFAAVPLQRQTASASQVLSEFAERDLVADFRLAPGSNPHFIMTTGSLGGLTTDSAAPLFVFETTSGQLNIYKVSPMTTSSSTRPAFALLERKVDARLAHAAVR